MTHGPIITLSGGVGGAKLVLGLAHVMPSDRLLVVTNTGDDFDHFGLRICPDTDTVIYTLSGLADPERGWGSADESWNFMQAMAQLGGEEWFNLGDRDLALHVFRTNLLEAGSSLSAVTAEIAGALGIAVPILPMCDEPVATMVETSQGRLSFQHYFVRERCGPKVTGFEFEGVDAARPNPAIVDAIDASPAAVLLAPSNPFVSVGPILAVPSMHTLLRNCGAPIVAVSPIVGGKALKGPAAKMMDELGLPASALEIAHHYRDFIDGLVIDETDAELAPAIEDLGISAQIAPTIMSDLDDRIDLARPHRRFRHPAAREDSPLTEIVIPIKRLSRAKQRLAGLLSPSERAGLVLAMLEDLLGAVSRADKGRIWLVASDDAVFDIGRTFGVRPIREHRTCGYNAAVALGFTAVAGPERPVAVLPGDLPLAGSGEITSLVAPLKTAPDIRIAGARDGRGTNGLFLSRPHLLSPAFGPDSFADYVNASHNAGITPRLLHAPGLAFDIDTPADLRSLARTAVSNTTQRFLCLLGEHDPNRNLQRGAA